MDGPRLLTRSPRRFATPSCHASGELASSGFDAAAVYRPDAAGLGVGGDWYKARRTPDGRLLVALGDARGHGLEAVTLMARLRYALGGLAYTEEPVEKLTQWLNQVACDDGIESTATAVVARYHPERELLRWTCVSHPRPVLLRDGRATQLPLPEGGPGISSDSCRAPPTRRPRSASSSVTSSCCTRTD